MMGIGTVMAITGLYGSYGLAGAVTAANGLGWAAGAAPLGNLVDRFGQRRVMLPCCLTSAGMLVVMIVAIQLHAPGWVLFFPAAISGFVAGSPGALVRARWAHATKNPAQLHSALSLESTLDELCFVIGPVVATVLSTQVTAVAGLVPPAVLGALGGTWFYSQQATEPPVQQRVPDAARTGPRGFLLTMPGVLPVVVIPLVVGLGFGAIDVSVVAATEAWGNKGNSAWVLAAMSAGSAIAGLLYGAKIWRVSLPRRFLIGLTALALGFGLMPAMRSALMLGLLGFVAGATVAPSFINANSLVQVLVPPRRLTEGLAWVGTFVGVGSAAGSAAAGQLVDAQGYRAAFWSVLGSGAVSLLVALISFRSVNRAHQAAVEARQAAREA
jgi:MFS family permease